MLNSGWLTSGPRVREFEKSFQEYVQADHAVAVNSGTAALHLALAAAGVSAGDEVITTPLTFCSTVNVIVQLGARPVLVDIDPRDLNIDPQAVEAAVTKRTMAIVPVHYGGQPCRLDELQELAQRQNALVIEDAAHATGAEYRGRPIGGIGDATAFSFYANKNLTCGEGGMVTTNDEALARRIRALALHGIDRDAWDRNKRGGSWYYEVKDLGYKYNLPDILAAVGIHQLQKLDGFNHRRAHLAELYSRLFAGLEEVGTPFVRPGITHAWHLYVIRLRLERLSIDRTRFIQLLHERGVGASVHFIPIHYHPWHREHLGYKSGDFPHAEAAYEGLVSLPIYPHLSDSHVKRVVESVKEIALAHSQK